MALIACGSETVEAPPPAPVNWRSIDAPVAVVVKAPTAKERAIADAYVNALASPRLVALGPLVDEVAHIAFGQKDSRGRDRVIQVHDQLLGAFDDRKGSVGRVWRTDEMQMVEWTVSGTQARDWMGIAATKRPVVIRGISILWTQDDGTLTDVHVAFNVAAVKAQLGVGPKELQDYVAALPPFAAQQVKPIDQTGSDVEKGNKVVVRGLLDALEHGNEAGYLETLADDVEIETPVRAKTQKKDDARAYYRMMRRSIGQLDTTIFWIQAIDRYVLLKYTISGEQHAPIDYTPVPPNREGRLDIVDIIEMRNGKIAHIWRYDGSDWPQ